MLCNSLLSIESILAVGGMSDLLVASNLALLSIFRLLWSPSESELGFLLISALPPLSIIRLVKVGKLILTAIIA